MNGDLTTYQNFHIKNEAFHAKAVKKSRTAAIKQIGVVFNNRNDKGGCVMNFKTMEGIVGARTNINLTDTTMRVYREARLKGDTVTMERAMDYTEKLSDKAQEYKAESDKGMKEEAKEVRKKEKAELEEAIRKSREEREKTEETTAKDRNSGSTDTLEISEEGKAAEKASAETGVPESAAGTDIKAAAQVAASESLDTPAPIGASLDVKA